MKSDVMDAFRKVGIIPVVKLRDPAGATPMARALLAGGLPAAEITFRSEAAEESIRRVAAQVPEILVCAGTVLTVENAKRAVDAGARAVISPGTNLEVVRWCLKQGVPVIPGCATPTEIEACMREGITFVKLFPAEVLGGVGMLKALAGPYGSMRFMPTGGVTLRNAADYLAQPNVVCCGGSWIAPARSLDEGDYAAVEAAARQAALCVKARG